MRFLPGLIGSTFCLTLLLGSAYAAGPSQYLGASPATTYTLTPAGEGRRNFLKMNCYGCHGMNGAGGMAINIQHAESGDLSEAINSGEDQGMPSFKKYFTATDITNMSAYLASIGTKNEPTFTHWWEAYPTQ